MMIKIIHTVEIQKKIINFHTITLEASADYLQERLVLSIAFRVLAE